MTTNQPGEQNVGGQLRAVAAARPDQVAVVMPLRRRVAGRRQYAQITFRELDEESDRLAAGLRALGATPGTRIVLLVKPSIEFIALVFAMLKAGIVIILIDPGMGRSNLLRCLAESRPQGFVAIPLAHALRTLMRRRFPDSKFHVTVGRRWWWGGVTLEQLRSSGEQALAAQPDFARVPTKADDPAAIIFTTGSTGPPKGVLYQHGNFARQVTEIRDFYQIQPGEVDLPGFPLFALFNANMGVTTVIPDMDFTRPARANPQLILEAARDWHVTQAFGSPALWNVVGRYCERTGDRIESLRRVLSAGAPVPPHVLERMRRLIASDGDVYTPYGATEALPVASISAREVLGETAARSRTGAGTCVGRRFPGIRWRVIAIENGPLPQIELTRELAPGAIGELMVQGPVVTRQYVTRTDANALHKVMDGEHFWHRLGDVGYLDEQDRFWFCGRKMQRVITARETLFTIPCEAIFNGHPRIYRSALVGLGTPGQQRPVMIVEPWPEHRPTSAADERQLIAELLQVAAAHPLTSSIHDLLIHPSMPVDIRHNAKIFREQLGAWAAKRLA
ncbi:MAG: fatty acid CoA ligase family protein [Planctomycetota bacterium]